jgi:hypothetical protein
LIHKGFAQLAPRPGGKAPFLNWDKKDGVSGEFIPLTFNPALSISLSARAAHAAVHPARLHLCAIAMHFFSDEIRKSFGNGYDKP